MEKFIYSLSLPGGAKSHVRVGDRVKAGEVVAEVGNVEEKVIEVASKLGVPNDQVGKYLKVALGQEIKEGDRIAVKGGVMGEKAIVSPVSGAVHRISGEEGVVFVRVQGSGKTKVVSFLAGEVSAVKADAIELSVSARVLTGELGQGALVSGILETVGDWGTAKLDQLSNQAEGKIVASADTVNGAWLTKAEALGVIGVIVGGVRDAEEHGTFPFVAMPHNDDGQMDKRVWEDLVKRSGMFAIIDPIQKRVAIIDAS